MATDTTGTLRPDIDAASRFGPSLRFIESIDRGQMNDWIDQLARQRPLIVTIDATDSFRHPWNVQSAWRSLEAGSGAAWHFNVHPGMVNEQDPTRPLAVEASGIVDAGIDDDPAPWFPIGPGALRKVGTDAGDFDGGGAVPDYFAALGVLPSPVAGASPFGLEVTLSGAFQGDYRLLRATELVLVQPRPALTARLEPGGIQFAYQVPADLRPNLNLVSHFERAAEVPLSVAEQLIGGYVDQAFEELHLATLYFLSPTGAPWGSEPDETWSAYAEHHVAWNLNFAIDQDLEIIQINRIEIPGLGLAGGVADLINQAVIDQVNGVLEQAAALLNQSRITGYFWNI